MEQHTIYTNIVFYFSHYKECKYFFVSGKLCYCTLYRGDDPLSFRACVQMNPFDLFKKIVSMQLYVQIYETAIFVIILSVQLR